MSQLTSPADPATAEPVRADPVLLSRVTGGLALGFLVLMYAGFSQEVFVTHADSLSKLQRVYGGADRTHAFAGGYVEALSFLFLAATLVLVPRVIGRRSEVGAVCARAFTGLGWVFIASTFAVGFPAAAAAVYGIQHGADVHAVAMVNDIRNYAFVLQATLQGAMALALGVAAVVERIFAKWVGWVGIVVGLAGILGAPFSSNVVGTLWQVWWVGLAVLLLRGPRR